MIVQLTLSVSVFPDKLLGASLWASESEDRDFRDEVWSSTVIDTEDQKNIQVRIDLPESGFRAFYIDLKYPDPNGGEYTKSTRMFVTDNTEILHN